MDDATHRDVLIAFDSDPGMFPQLYIGVKRLTDLERFIALVEGLASGEHSSVEVADSDWAYLENVVSVQMEASEADSGSIVIEPSANGVICRWTNEKAGWEFAADLLKVLREGRPGFQYLPPEADNAEVEFDSAGNFDDALASRGPKP
jgi:hypothetical protein